MLSIASTGFHRCIPAQLDSRELQTVSAASSPNLATVWLFILCVLTKHFHLSTYASSMHYSLHTHTIGRGLFHYTFPLVIKPSSLRSLGRKGPKKRCDTHRVLRENAQVLSNRTSW